jgi:hypothetical protein
MDTDEVVAAILTIALHVSKPRDQTGPIRPEHIGYLVQDYRNVLTELKKKS